MHAFYNAPFSLYASLNKFQDYPWRMRRELNVCVGNEWHRFPSHFFLPQGFRLSYVKENFAGLLPKYFEETSLGKTHQLLAQGRPSEYIQSIRAGRRNTDLNVSGMNDLNLEELDRYVMLFFWIFKRSD